MSAVRSYLRFGLPYRGLDELLAKRGVEVHHVTLFRWVQRFTRLLIDRSPTLQPNPAAQPCRRMGDRWFVDEIYIKAAGSCRYVCCAIDEHGQVIDILVSLRRDIAAARFVFALAVPTHGRPD